jgi:hypothetical protein
MSALHVDAPRATLFGWLFVAAALAAGWSGAVRAAETYLILSLIGDRFTVVTNEQQIGSNLDRHQHRVVSITGSALDDFAVRVADATIAKAKPDASVTMLRSKDPTLYALGETLADADVPDAKSLLPQLEGAFAGASDARLLLIAPLRTAPDLRTDRVHVGGGKAAGLGFYIDSNLALRSEKTNAIGRGFLGVFANFQLLIVDAKSNELVARQRVTAGATYAAADSFDATPWNTLTDAQKMRALQSLLKSEIERVLPPMLTAK